MTNQELIMSYYQNPVNNYVMQDFSIINTEWNPICWDNITVYIKVQEKRITERSFSWQTSMITTASAGFFSELVIWENIDNILNRNKDNFIENWFDVSERRKRAMVMPLVATINWIYSLKNISIKKTLEEYV